MTETNAPGLTANCEIHDSEILAIEEVLLRLRERADSGGMDLGLFDQEIQERFAAIGFVTTVNWFYTNVEGVKIPEIVITDRTEKKDFDYDQQVAEVTRDILDLGQKGVIASDPEVLDQGHQGHQH